MNRFLQVALLRLHRWLLALALLTPVAASATHIVGGELDLQHKSGNTYALSLNLYFDAIYGNPSALDQQFTASIFAKSDNRRMANVTIQLVSNAFVNYTNPACTVSSVSTRKLVYTADVRLEAGIYNSPAGYYVAVERCCRNNGISNITNPAGAAQTFYLEFPAVVRGGAPFIDSTPRIFPPLGDYACRGELFYYDFGGQDADGDSLAYDMVTPLNGYATAAPDNTAPLPRSGPYAPISWRTGLSANNQIPGSPTLGIHPQTGRLTVRPTDVGLFVFGVRCSEYRRGVKIGESRRDFQLYVLNCPTNRPPVAVTNIPGTTRPYRPGLDTLRLVPGSNRCLTFRYTDPDPNSVLTMTARPVNFQVPVPIFITTRSGRVRGPGAPDTLSATLCFPDCANTRGQVYLLDVIVADNGCSLPKRDTVRVAFTATQPPNAAPVLTSTLPPVPTPAATPAVVRLTIGQRYTATLTGTDADNHVLTLRGVGNGFDLAAVGMTLTAQNGTGRASGTFTWEPTCASVAAAGADGGLLVLFQLAETGPCEPVLRERAVRFEVLPQEESGTFRPANIITPNGDSKNDYLAMPDLPLDFCDRRFASIKIFSRWGQRVYESSERGFKWAGSGLSGTYYYLVTYTDGRKYKGWVEVRP